MGKVVELAQEEFRKLKDYDCEFVLVNDYSRDNTWQVIKELSQRYPNVKGNPFCQKLRAAQRHHGRPFLYKGELIVGMDDDMQNHPSQIPQFLKKMEEGFDVVFGVFKERKFSAIKNITGSVSRFLLWRLLDRPKDIQMSSFWCCRRYVRDEVGKVRWLQCIPPGAVFQDHSQHRQY